MLLQLKKMCKEGAYWGTVAGVYVGMEYGVKRIRGTRDWKNAMICGAVTGALVSAAGNNKATITKTKLWWMPLRVVQLQLQRSSSTISPELMFLKFSFCPSAHSEEELSGLFLLLFFL